MGYGGMLYQIRLHIAFQVIQKTLKSNFRAEKLLRYSEFQNFRFLEIPMFRAGRHSDVTLTPYDVRWR